MIAVRFQLFHSMVAVLILYSLAPSTLECRESERDARELEVYVMGKRVSKATKERLYVPARTALSVLIPNRDGVSGDWSLSSEQFPDLNVTYSKHAGPVFFTPKYPWAGTPDTIKIQSRDTSGAERTVTFQVVPIDGLIREDGSDQCNLTLQDDIESIICRYEIRGWDPALVGRLRLGLIGPVVGSPWLEIGSSEVGAAKGTAQIKSLPGWGTGIAAITVFLKRADADLWDEIGWRTPINVWVETKPLVVNQNQDRLKSLEVILNEAWPDIAKGKCTTKDYVDGFLILKGILNHDSPKVAWESLLRHPSVIGGHRLLAEMWQIRNASTNEEKANFVLRRAAEFIPTTHTPLNRLTGLKDTPPTSSLKGE
ncbi:MAG: hypothetical protein AMXMBFR7_27980 [Planctomycetota bacterium]